MSGHEPPEHKSGQPTKFGHGSPTAKLHELDAAFLMYEYKSLNERVIRYT